MKHKDKPLSPKTNKHCINSQTVMRQLAVTINKKLQSYTNYDDPITNPNYSARINKIYIRQKSQHGRPSKAYQSLHKKDFQSGIEQQAILQSKSFRTPDLRNNNFNLKLSTSLPKKDNFSTINFPQSTSIELKVKNAKASLDSFVSLHELKSFFEETHLNSESQSTEIYAVFQQFLQLKQLFVRNPVLKKYKNCVYFGEPIQQKYMYKGFLYFWKRKIYYGQMLNEKKHGKGKQVNWQDNFLYEGTFVQGKKTGYFVIEKPGEKYQGQLLEGKYHGKGKLTSHLSQYIGDFVNGLRHGRGQQFFYNSKLTIKGTFSNGIFSNQLPGQQCFKNKPDSMQPQSYKNSRYNYSQKKQTEKFAINIQQFSFSIDDEFPTSSAESDCKNYKLQNPQEKSSMNFRNFRRSYNMGVRKQN